MNDYHERLPDGGAMETDQDLETERRVMGFVESHWSCSLVKQQQFDPMDYVAVRDDKTVAWVEVRKRNIPSNKYKEIFMGYEKFQKLSLAARALYIPCVFFVVFTDAMMWVDLTRVMPKTRFASRGAMKHKRATDNERSVLIPVSSMRLAA